MKTDVSIHFTTKGQTVAEINSKLNDYIDKNQGSLPFDFSERTEPRSVLHHCFLPEKIVKEKGFPNDIYEDILHPISEHKVCWYGTSDYGLVWDRILMLENLKKLNGIAIFIGEIKDGVKDEYDLVLELGIEHLIINKMKKDEILNILQNLILEFDYLSGYEKENIKMDSNFKSDLGFDSLDIVEFIIKIEKKFDVRIEDEEFEKIQTVENLVDYIYKNLVKFP